MPAHQRLRLEDNRGFEQGREQPIEPDEDRAICRAQPEPRRRGSRQHNKLLAEKCHLGFASRMRSEHSDEQSAEQLQELDHPKERIAHRSICASPDAIFGSHTGWQVDDQPLDLALGDRGELGRDHLDVPVWQKRRLWVEFAETALGEITEIGSQDRVVFARRKVFDHAPPPRSRAFMRAMICWSASVKVGSAEWGSLSPSMSLSIPNRIWMALKSALAERLTSWVTIASRLLTLPPALVGDH